MKGDLKNEFSWSKSRDNVFTTCSRQYYYNYYAFWGGWAADAPEETRNIYILKNLKTRQMWAGEHVHRAVHRSIQNLARGVDLLGVEQIIGITLDTMRNEFRFSREGLYRKRKGCALFEHEYSLPVSDAQWKETAGVVETSLENFYRSEVFKSLTGLPGEDFLEMEELSHFEFEGTRIWVVLDAAWRTADGLTIADWKTGKTDPGGHELQLTGYALYAAEKWQMDIADLTLVEYNLFTDRIHHYTVDRDTVERTLTYIRGSIADMKSLLADHVENIPLGEERFPKVLVRRTCSRCNYQKVCKPELED
jgi:CRISPR/Cas system-associated exonuclease Cas4 (RecB family)